MMHHEREPSRRSKEESQRKSNTPQSGGWLEIGTPYTNYLSEYSGLGNPLVPMVSTGTFLQHRPSRNYETTPQVR